MAMNLFPQCRQDEFHVTSEGSSDGPAPAASGKWGMFLGGD